MQNNKDQVFESINLKLNQTKFHCQCGVQHTECQHFLIKKNLQNCNRVYTVKHVQQKQLDIEKSQIQRLQQAYIFYKQYEGSISQADLAMTKNSLFTSEQNQQLTRQEHQLQTIFDQLKKKQSETLTQMENLKSRVLQLDQEEGRYWQQMNKFQKKLFKLEQKANTARWESKMAQDQYDRLARFSVINEVFKITCQGQVALINGLALGKRPRSKDVDWQQVNAALGHLFLLFCFLILKHQYSCVRLEQMQCLGSYSTVKIKEKKYEIAYSKDKQKQFGQVMDQLMIQFELFHRHLQLTSFTQIQLPYKITIGQHKIQGLHINPNRIKSVKWDTWSKSMKYFLTNFEYVAANYSS